MMFQTDVNVNVSNGGECAVEIESHLHTSRRLRKQNLKDDDSTELYKVDVNHVTNFEESLGEMHI